jgi:hypothetical protein
MHPLAFNEHVSFPRSVTYLRPGLSRRSSRADTPLASSSGACSLAQPMGQLLRTSAGPYGGRPHHWSALEAYPLKGGLRVSHHSVPL